MDEWRGVVGFLGLYEVSRAGEVRNARSGRIISATFMGRSRGDGTRRRGYLSVTLHRDGSRRSVRVHHLVLEAFVGPRPPHQECRHKNGDVADNRLVNLTWGTRRENAADKRLHGTAARGERNGKFRDATIARVRALRAAGMSLRRISSETGVSKSHVGDVLFGKRRGA